MDGAEITVGLGTNDEGINFFDTATKYGPQDAVGQGLEGLPRDSYILSTKFNFVNKADGSLRALRTDYMDIYSRASFSISHFPFVFPEYRVE